MNKTLNIIALSVAIVAMIISGVAIMGPVKVVIPEMADVGALVGPDIYHAVKVHGAFNWGGKVLVTTTTATAETLTGTTMADYDYIDVMSNTGALTYTLPATSTMISLLPSIGSTRIWLFHNATSSSGITLTIAEGAGMDVVAVDANADVLAPGDWGTVTCTQIHYRTADNENIMCEVRKLINAD